MTFFKKEAFAKVPKWLHTKGITMGVKTYGITSLLLSDIIFIKITSTQNRSNDNIPARIGEFDLGEGSYYQYGR